MAIDFKEKFASLQAKDSALLTEEELGYIKNVEDYIDSEIERKLSTDNKEVWIDTCYIEFRNTPKGDPFPCMTNKRRDFLKQELLRRYNNANWEIDWHIDDGLDGPNMSGGDYLILKGN
jgi:hypothetical protein